MRRGACKFRAQLSAGIDERAAGHVQAHHFHHHLVAVGRAKKGASARPVIGCSLSLKQFFAAHFAFGIQLADALLFLIGKPRGHWPGRNQGGRQMAKAQRADQQPRHNLVTNAEQRHRIKHPVR